MKLFEDQLKDMYWAEKALTKALSKMIKNVSTDELAEAIKNQAIDDSSCKYYYISRNGELNYPKNC